MLIVLKILCTDHAADSFVLGFFFANAPQHTQKISKCIICLLFFDTMKIFKFSLWNLFFHMCQHKKNHNANNVLHYQRYEWMHNGAQCKTNQYGIKKILQTNSANFFHRQMNKNKYCELINIIYHFAWNHTMRTHTRISKSFNWRKKKAKTKNSPSGNWYDAKACMKSYFTRNIDIHSNSLAIFKVHALFLVLF